jgi:uncharacterized protein
MNRNELVLAVLAAGNGAIHTPVQIQKLFFLIDRKLAGIGGPFFNFIPYDYGPFDKDVYRAVEALSEGGDAEIIRNPCLSLNEYRLTPEGQKKGELILNSLDSNNSDFIKRLSEFVRSLSFAELVSAIYQAYPEMKANSVFKEI